MRHQITDWLKEDSDWLTSVSTAVYALIMVPVLFYTRRAWRTATAEGSYGRIGAYLTEITSSGLSKSRDRVFAWVLKCP